MGCDPLLWRGWKSLFLENPYQPQPQPQQHEPESLLDLSRLLPQVESQTGPKYIVAIKHSWTEQNWTFFLSNFNVHLSNLWWRSAFIALNSGTIRCWTKALTEQCATSVTMWCSCGPGRGPRPGSRWFPLLRTSWPVPGGRRRTGWCSPTRCTASSRRTWRCGCRNSSPLLPPPLAPPPSPPWLRRRGGGPPGMHFSRPGSWGVRKQLVVLQNTLFSCAMSVREIERSPTTQNSEMPFSLPHGQPFLVYFMLPGYILTCKIPCLVKKPVG